MWFADYTFSGRRAPAACTEPGDGGPGQGNRAGIAGVREKQRAMARTIDHELT